jgi:3-hydroxybutyryl-CoA dehydratase
MSNAKRPTSLLGQGFFWQDLSVGQRFKTYRRTVTESDLVGFINCTGMLEVVFIDAEYSAQFGAVKGRLVPAALSYGLIEGMLFQTMMQGTGLAMLEVHKKAVKPVLVGDSIWATVEITAIKPTSREGRAVLTSQVDVFNQRDELVLTYEILRLVRGR